jgi:CBS domain-containing protein
MPPPGGSAEGGTESSSIQRWPAFLATSPRHPRTRAPRRAISPRDAVGSADRRMSRASTGWTPAVAVSGRRTRREMRESGGDRGPLVANIRGNGSEGSPPLRGGRERAHPRSRLRGAVSEVDVSNFQMPVELYMTSPVHTVGPDDDLREAQRILDGMSISSLAVVTEEGELMGVISRTDLIRVGRRQAGSRGKAALLTLPEMPVSRRMSTEVVKLHPQDSIAIAAKQMVKGRFHRVFVEESGKLTGVLSTKDVMLAIRDKRVKTPISEWMSSPVFTIRADEPVSLATERLEKARVTGLVVVEDDWPVGSFTQREALEAHDRERNTPVEEVMNAALLALDVDTPLHRAAAQAAATRVWMVIAVRGRRMEGILTGIDFARAAAT